MNTNFLTHALDNFENSRTEENFIEIKHELEKCKNKISEEQLIYICNRWLLRIGVERNFLTFIGQLKGLIKKEKKIVKCHLESPLTLFD